MVTARPRAVLVALLAISAWLAAGLSYTEVRSIGEGELPDSDWLGRDTELFESRHPDRNYYVVGVEAVGPDGIWNADTLAKIAAISDEVGLVPGAAPNVQSLSTWEHVTALADSVRIQPLMPAGPLGTAEIARIREISRADRLLSGRLVSEDGRMALIRATFRGDAEEAAVHDGLEALRARFEGPERIALFGAHHVNHEIDLAVNAHLGVLLPVAIALLFAFLYAAFGRLQAVWIPAGLMALSVEWLLGLMGRLEIPRSVLTSVVPLLLVVVLGSHVVHLLARVYQEAERHPWPLAVERALAATAPPIAIATATTAIGFATLVVFQIYSVREFGVVAALAVAFGGLLTLTWVPAALLVFARRAPRPLSRGRRAYVGAVAAVVDLFAAIARRRRLAPLLVAAGVGLLALLGVAQLRAGNSPPRFFPEGHRTRTDFESLLRQFGGNGFVFVEIEREDGSDIYDPDFLERVLAFQHEAETLATVASVSSVVDTVLMRVNRRMNEDDAAHERVPASPQLAAQYLELYRWDAPETLAEMVENTDSPRRLVVDVLADVTDSSALSELISKLVEGLRRRLRSGERAVFGGEFALWSAQNPYIVRGKLLNLAAAIALVGLVCFVALRRARAAVVALLPASFAALIVFGLMGAIGIRLDLASCVITSVVVGVGVDFSVHFLFRYREVERLRGDAEPAAAAAEAVRLAGPPILFDAGSNVIAFGVFLLSGLVPVRDFGWLICVSMVACTSATLALLPQLVAAPSGGPGGRRDR